MKQTISVSMVLEWVLFVLLCVVIIGLLWRSNDLYQIGQQNRQETLTNRSVGFVNQQLVRQQLHISQANHALLLVICRKEDGGALCR